MFPNEDDDAQYLDHRFGMLGTPAWTQFTSISEVTDDLIGKIRQQYCDGISSMTAFSSCHVMKLNDLPPRAAGQIRRLAEERLALAEMRELAGTIRRLIESDLARKIDTSKMYVSTIDSSASTSDVLTISIRCGLHRAILTDPRSRTDLAHS